MTIGPIAYSCRSVPQMPHQSGRRSTSPGPGPEGSPTSSTRMSCSPWKTAAFISSFQAGVEKDLALDLPGGESVEVLGEPAEREHTLEELLGERGGREDVQGRREVRTEPAGAVQARAGEIDDGQVDVGEGTQAGEQEGADGAGPDQHDPVAVAG